MKVIGFNGSPRTQGNTFAAMRKVFQELESQGIETEMIQVGKETVRGCQACNGCVKNQNRKCVLTGDSVNDWISKMLEADGILLGSPVHYSGMGGTFKSFLDRAFYVCSVNGSLLRHKVGASLAAVRRSGGLPTIQQMNHYLLYSEMLIPGSSYWNVVHGLKPGEIEQDAEGVQILRVLGKNLAWLLKLVELGKKQIPAPELEPKILTNFIRP